MILVTDPRTEMVFANFTDDEERKLARVVFTILSCRGIGDAFHEFTKQTFWYGRAQYASRVKADDLISLDDYIMVWRKLVDLERPVFDLNENKEAMFDTGSSLGNRMFVLSIWKEIWAEFVDRLEGSEFKTFVGQRFMDEVLMIDNPDPHFERAAEFEEKFWAEVDKIHKEEPDESRYQVYLYVRDYRKRGRDVIPVPLLKRWMELETKILSPNQSHNDDDEMIRAIEQYRYRSQFPGQSLD